jgi:glutathionylspermidine synthase
MRREPSPPRPDFADEAAAIGFTFASPGGETYWNEGARCVFSLDEIENSLEIAAKELHALSFDLVDRVVGDEEALTRLAIPRHVWDLIYESWLRGDPSLYRRFDFGYDGKKPPKLLEYNADTPTSLYESAVLQWRWLEQGIERGFLPKGADQFNSLHERLIDRWRAIGGGELLHFACLMRDEEDRGTLAYLEDCARQAGFETQSLDVAAIGFDGSQFYDPNRRAIRRLFKLYPWEWMFADEFGRTPAMRKTLFLEPPWKVILSCKGALALLWKHAPNHPNLLPCYFEDDPSAPPLACYARKPLYSREGANIELVTGSGRLTGRDGHYGAEGFVRQQMFDLPTFDGVHPVLGCWIVGDAPAGMGVREDPGLITTNRSQFVPHMIA